MINKQTKVERLVTDAPSYATQATQLIKDVILRGEYKAGQWLSEGHISESIGISRSPIREAFQKLAKEGLIELVPRKGAFVATLGLKEVEDLFEVREVLEIMAVRLASDRARQSQLDALSEFMESTTLIIKGNKYTEYPWSFDFHLQLVRCAQNKKLEEKVHEVNARLLLVRHRSASESGRAQNALMEHKKVLEAVHKRDPDAAERLMKSHIRTARENVTKIVTGGTKNDEYNK